jgi:hypothetical protein
MLIKLKQTFLGRKLLSKKNRPPHSKTSRKKISQGFRRPEIREDLTPWLGYQNDQKTELSHHESQGYTDGFEKCRPGGKCSRYGLVGILPMTMTLH